MLTETEPSPELQFILKIASRCNLNCHYCYVYNKGDSSWRQRPAFMSSAVLSTALKRIRAHCLRSGQPAVRITFHGGEPCLIDPDLFAGWCQEARDLFSGVCRLELSIQTNGTLIDQRWVDVFRRYAISVGLSIDGPPDIHDAARVDHLGRGSYEKVVNGLQLLRENKIPFQILCVIQFGIDSLRVHRHFLGLGATRIHYILPDFTHDTIGPVRARYGPTPCADYLLPILEEWWASDEPDVRIAIFWNMAKVVLGARTQIDLLGNGRYQYIFVEADGDIEGLDVLRICDSELPATRLNVMSDDFADVGRGNSLHRQVIFEGLPLPTGCHGCPEQLTCGGGYLPHRFSRERGLDNPTVWCEDMLRLFGRVRQLLNVDVEETVHRQAILQESYV